MLARVEVCPDTWRPVGFGQALVGWDEPGAAAPPSLWVFEDWQRWEAPAAAAAVGTQQQQQQQGHGHGHAHQQQQHAGCEPGRGWRGPAARLAMRGACRRPTRLPSFPSIKLLAPPPPIQRVPAVHFPLRVRHNAAVGGAHDYYTTRVLLQAARISSVAYTIPLCAKLPVDASFDVSHPPGTWVRGRGGVGGGR
jgi:hypothetical protein